MIIMKIVAKILLFFFCLSIFVSHQNNSTNLAFASPNLVLQQDEADTAETDAVELINIDSLIKLFDGLKGNETDKSRDSLYFEIVKSFDVFAAAFRELLENYVIEIPPFELVRYALEGLTKELDPYTNYFSNENELNEIISNKEYIGLGIVVNVVDSSLIVVDYVDSSAKYISNLKLGDRIVFIDSIKLAPNLDTLRKYTSGKENSRIELLVEREGVDSLLRLEAFRRKIEIEDVSYHKIFDLDDGKALYINIEHFTPEMPQSVRNILQTFTQYNASKRKGIIIDLRDNPGGTLESAIQICEMFLPPGSTIVSTRGRSKTEEKTYKAVTAPLDTTTPLVILVNKGSASASEIVAGAIQDNDRGIIIGDKTFGKGIIQSIASLPYDSYLKITTAKYFTPSGRSIHQNHYASIASRRIGKLFVSDSLFHTKKGRIVKQSNGIQPDIEIKEKDDNSFMNFLDSKALIIRFVSYLESNTELNLKLLDNPKSILNSFVDFLKRKKIEYKTWVENEMDSIIEKLEKDRTQKVIVNKLKKIRMEIHKPIDRYVEENSKEILAAIENEIERRIVSFNEYRFYALQQDDYFKASVQLLKERRKYFEMLGISN